MESLKIFIDKNPGKIALIGLLLCLVLLYVTRSTATIEIIDGKQYVIAIDGKSIDPRIPNRYDIDLHWEIKESKE